MACDGCSGGCTSCHGTCDPGCWGGCDGGCGGGCTSCTSCSGCYGGCEGTCDTTCSGSCSGRCKGGCKGCGGACSSSCTSCSGTCNGCDNGCTSTEVANFFNTLGTNITLNTIIKAEDINNVAEAIIKELTRRGKTSTNVKTEIGSSAATTMLQSIHNNCVTGGYATTEATAVGTKLSADQIQRYITFIKGLYAKNIKA